MPQLYYNKYRIPSTRLRHWNYANEGMYFITICTKNREHYFGEIDEPTKIGRIAFDEWLKTPTIRPDMNLQLGEFVVMPNHFHAIITIGANEYNNTDTQQGTENGMDQDTEQGRKGAMHRASTSVSATNQFSPQSKNLASIIRGYKSAVTTFARKNGILFEWQPRYHDHIIRSDGEYRRISRYILDNPAKWLNQLH